MRRASVCLVRAAAGIRALAVSPDAHHVYVGGLAAGQDGGPFLGGFDRLADGTLVPLADEFDLPTDEGWKGWNSIGVINVVVSPDGGNVVVSLGGLLPGEEYLYVFTRLPETGALVEGQELSLGDTVPGEYLVAGANLFAGDGSALLSFTWSGLVRFSVTAGDSQTFEPTGALLGGQGDVPSLPYLTDPDGASFSQSGEYLLVANPHTSSLILLATDSCP